MRLLHACILVLLFAAAGMVPRQASASVYSFSALCTDCTGADSGTSTVSGTLVLTGDTPGTAVDASNFVSFTYNGSDIVGAFADGPGDISSFAASFTTDATQSAPLTLVESRDGGYTFTTSADGTWSITVNGGAQPEDVGTDATYTVPEPASFALLAMGIVSLVVARRRGGVSGLS